MEQHFAISQPQQFPLAFKSKHINVSLTTVQIQTVYLADLCKLNSGRKSRLLKNILEHRVQGCSPGPRVPHILFSRQSFLNFFPKEVRLVFLGGGEWWQETQRAQGPTHISLMIFTSFICTPLLLQRGCDTYGLLMSLQLN